MQLVLLSGSSAELARRPQDWGKMRDIRPSLVPNLSPDIKMLKGNLHNDLSLDLRSSHKAPSAPEISDSAGGRPAAMIPRPAAIRAEDERDMNDVQK